MSVNQWKLLVQLKDSISKLSNDKSLQNVFGKDFMQLMKLPTTTDAINIDSSPKSMKQETSYNLPNIFINNLQKKTTKTATQEPDAPKWRNKLVPQCNVSLQTEQLILWIEAAESDSILLSRIETLLLHIKQYPEARNPAIKAGAIRLLLRIRAKRCSEKIQELVREALAVFGYSDPVPGRGIRILTIDGGGIRGLLVLEMLKKLEELTGKPTHEMFDLLCGVSTGAILSFSIGIHHKPLTEIAERYKAISMEVFKQSALWGTGNLVWSQAYYDTALWEAKLKEHLGSNTLISTARDASCPKLCAVSAVVNQSHLSAYVFRNYSLPWRVKSQYFGSDQAEVWQAARASASAPTYFEEFKLGQFLHQDGGILVNNPTAVALHEAKLIWPNTPIQCVVSFGTGRSVPSPVDLAKEVQPISNNSTSWANKFYKILDSATDTEGVHIMLNDLLPDHVYYRFNPYLTEMISMVEINPKKLEQLERDALMYLRRNEDKFQEAAQALTEKKPHLRKVQDLINVKRELYGV